MAYNLTFSIVLGQSQTGLTLRAQLKNTAGTSVGSLVTTGFVELGVGNYLWTGSIPDDHDGGVVFTKSDGTVMACTSINAVAEGAVRVTTEGITAESFETDAISADALSEEAAVEIVAAMLDEPVADHTESGTVGQRLASIANTGIGIVSATFTEDSIAIVRGDDYTDEDGRAAEFVDDDGIWPDLTGATVTWRAYLAASPDPVLEVEMEITAASGASKIVILELTADQTAELEEDSYVWDAKAELANGHVSTLMRGNMTLFD